jgi:hypothetical protein
MSAVKNLIMDIQAELTEGKLSFQEIAAKFEVPTSWVEEAHQEMVEWESEADPGEMDGDEASALASAGWGTDEDYVCDNDYFDDY